MLSKNDLTSLTVTQKRQVVRALLKDTFDQSRSFPLSYAQEQLWFMDRLHPGSSLYMIPLYVPFQGPIAINALQRALEILTQRHDMLRVRFGLSETKEPVQIVEPTVDVPLSVENLSSYPEEQRREFLSDRLRAEVLRPFDLEHAPCIRYHLYRVDANHSLLGITLHHIIADAWSLGVLVSELNTLYRALRSGEPKTSPLKPLLVEYSDYARWQRQTLRGLRLTKLLQYWRTQLDSAPHVIDLPTDHPRPNEQTFNGTVASFVFDDTLSTHLIALARERRVTVFMLLLACYFVLLYRYTGQEDILVGCPVANRDHPELEPVIGIFVNTLILRQRFEESQTFVELLKHVESTVLSAFEHQALPFPMLLDELGVERVPGFAPLYQVVFNFQNASLIESDNPGAEAEAAQRDFPLVHSKTSKVDLNLTVTQNSEVLSGGIEYNTDLFAPDTIASMITHYEVIAKNIVANPNIPLIEISLEDQQPGQKSDGSQNNGFIADLDAFDFDMGANT